MLDFRSTLEKQKQAAENKSGEGVSSGREKCKWCLPTIASVLWMECAQSKLMGCLK